MYYYILVSSRAATILWGRLATCGRLLIGQLSAAGAMPEEGHRGSRLAAGRGTVENLAPSSCDVAAGPCITTVSEEVRPGEVFITFGGPQGHDDRMASCGGLATRLLAVVRSLPRIAASRKPRWPSSGIAPTAESWPINNRPQVANLPHNCRGARGKQRIVVQERPPTMRIHFHVAHAIIAAIFVFAVHADIIDRIAVSVGNHVITASDLDRETRVTAFLNGIKPNFTPTARRATAGRMVEQALVRSELENSRYPTPAPSDVDPVLAQLKKERFPNHADFERALPEYGITEQDVRNELLWQRTLLSFLDVRFRPSVQLTDKEIQEYFQKTVQPAAQLAHPGQPVALDNYRDEIETTLTGQREDQAMSAWLDQAKKRTQIVYHDEAFQ
jgi:peptidyl-prolyl cis-trans isomerase SurA